MTEESRSGDTLEEQETPVETPESAVVTEVRDLAEETTAPVAPVKAEPAKGSRSYELIFVVDAGLAKEELDRITEKLQNFIETRQGIVQNIRVSDTRRLSYPIKKRTHGVYGVVNFWLRPDQITELERLIALDDRILRHLVIQVVG
ncbi:MAG: 30S ribosomal protein S6 [Armatimonadota bacterium]|nr:30S ribosomal protein S6 [Armatimonadota bacterium]